ncbi:MAG: hypothetical protein R3F61_13950 [Myxococcota bacterium]
MPRIWAPVAVATTLGACHESDLHFPGEGACAVGDERWTGTSSPDGVASIDDLIQPWLGQSIGFADSALGLPAVTIDANPADFTGRSTHYDAACQLDTSYGIEGPVTEGWLEVSKNGIVDVWAEEWVQADTMRFDYTPESTPIFEQWLRDRWTLGTAQILSIEVYARVPQRMGEIVVRTTDAQVTSVQVPDLSQPLAL